MPPNQASEAKNQPHSALWSLHSAGHSSVGLKFPALCGFWTDQTKQGGPKLRAFLHSPVLQNTAGWSRPSSTVGTRRDIALVFHGGETNLLFQTSPLSHWPAICPKSFHGIEGPSKSLLGILSRPFYLYLSTTAWPLQQSKTRMNFPGWWCNNRSFPFQGWCGTSLPGGYNLHCFPLPDIR